MIPLARGAAIPLVNQTLSPTSGESCTTGVTSRSSMYQVQVFRLGSNYLINYNVVQHHRLCQVHKQYTSNSPNNYYEDKVLSQERDDNNKLLLSSPYDMTKVNSGFTSITQKTQKESNMSTTAPSCTMRTDMANKYKNNKSKEKRD
jgi:hypothetical protein